MPNHIALLRAINVGGRNRVAMADLRALFDKLTLGPAKTLLQSGNVVFPAGSQKGPELEKLLEAATAKQLGVPADYLVRSAAEWDAIIARNPFPEEAGRDPAHLVVVCLKTAAQLKDVKVLEAAIRGPELVRAVGKELYAVYPIGIGESKLTNTLIEQKLGTRGTARNWNTVLKLAALVRD